MLNTYLYATAEELRIHKARQLTEEDEAIIGDKEIEVSCPAWADEGKTRRIFEAASRRGLSVAQYVARQEAQR
jgi:hypothetical protein